MKVAIYSPYLDTFGGGERYMMTIAEIFSNMKVDVLLDNHLENTGAQFLKKELQSRFNLRLENVSFIKSPIGKGTNLFQRMIFLKKYDLFFYLTDGSIFIPSARKNILHIQTPLIGQPAGSLWGRIKLKGWNLVIFNSEFTKEHSRKYWPLSSKVIYPPVDIDQIKPLKKKKYILSVGRFFGFLKSKKQELMIKVFNELNKDLDGWSLNLAGSASKGDGLYLKDLKKLANKLPINFYPNLGYDDLIKLYGESSIYWHAAGFGEDNPSKMEHFGISTVEAMAGGCVPVVIGNGGQKEIVENGKSGFIWDSLDELKEFTIKLAYNQPLMQRMSKEGVARAGNFSKNKFKQNILSLI